MGWKLFGSAIAATAILTLAAATLPAAAQVIAWPASVRQIAIVIPTGPRESQFAGDITLPAAQPPGDGWPGAVILEGSGPTDRNGDIPGEPVQSHPYEKLAAYLSAHGVIDWRGA